VWAEVSEARGVKRGDAIPLYASPQTAGQRQVRGVLCGVGSEPHPLEVARNAKGHPSELTSSTIMLALFKSIKVLYLQVSLPKISISL
jgi:hypothetical protein